MKTETVKLKNTRSLTTTLAISFFSVSALVLLLSSSLQIALSIQAQQAEIEGRQLLIARDAGKSVSNFIQEKFSDMETAVEFSNPITASPQTRTTVMQSLLGLDPAFRQFVLLDSHAEQLDIISRVSQTLSTQFIAQLTGDVLSQTESDQFYIGSVYIDDITSEPLIALAIPIKTVLGDYQGTLATEVNLKFIWDLVDQIRVGETGYVYVVDAQGNLIAYKDTALVLQGRNVSEIGGVSEFVRNPSGSADTTAGVQTYTGLSDAAVVGTYIPLGSPQWAVVIELPRREAYQDVITLGLRSLALIFIIGIVASLAGFFGARRTSAPLVDLSNVAAEVARGNLGAQAKETGPAELVQLASSFNNMTSQLRDSIGNLERRVDERTADLENANAKNERRAAQFEAIAQVSRTITSTQDLNTLLPQIASVISRLFGFYHVGIFLLDSRGEYAILSAANSEGGKRMLARNHRLKVGETGIVGYATGTGNPRVALDTGADAVYFDNPDLRSTRSEMALPLKAGGRVIGALDVQSQEPNAFAEEDVSILSTLADQVGIAIQNSRQYEETSRALAESESLSRQFIQQGWQQFTKSRNLAGIRHTGAKATILYAKNGEGKGESRSNKEQAGAKSRSVSLALPVKLRGEVIGSVEVRSPGNRQWDQDELDIVTAIIERAAVALENSRLLGESQKRAAKERVISEISTRISAQSNIDELMKTAAQELGRALPKASISIQFKKDEETE